MNLPKTYLLYLFAAFIIILLASLGPLISYGIQSHVNYYQLLSYDNPAFIYDPIQIYINLIKNLNIFVYLLFPALGQINIFVKLLFYLVLITGIVNLFFNMKKVFWEILLLLAIVLNLFLGAFIKSENFQEYINPSIGLFFIIFSRSTLHLNKWKLKGILGYLFLMLALFAATNGFRFNQHFLDFSQKKEIDSASAAVKQEVIKLKKDNRYEDYRFFQISSFRTGNKYVSNAVLWVPLERLFNYKFVKLDNNDGQNFKPLNDNSVVFLACYNQRTNYLKQDCIDFFHSKFPLYDFNKEVFVGSNIKILLMNKK